MLLNKPKINPEIIKLCRQEQGWIVENNTIIIEDKVYPILHPYKIHIKRYREETDPAVRLQAMRRIHDLLWPEHILTYNDWTDRRFLAHCSGYSQVVLAGGAAAGKSMDAAKIALIFWLSDPKHNACIIASTTLEALESRIWGYVAKLFGMAALPIAGLFLRSKPPKILYPGQIDKIHGMFAIAIRSGEDSNTLSTIIGRHPDKGLMMVLDESTDMPPSIVKSLPNLEQGIDTFQLWAIGNSCNKFDLHGALATPKKGWNSINPEKDYSWETMHKNGICLYFSPYDSPAITEKDPKKKAALSKFLITEEGIEEKKKVYGEGTDSYARFVLGFWQSTSMNNSLLGQQFLTEHLVEKGAEWSGFYAKEIVAGLDPAFQVGASSGCLLRLAVFGHTTTGLVALDYRKEDLIFRIEMTRDPQISGELQLAKQVVAILERYNCPIEHLAIDASGVGRALGELIRLVSGQMGNPLRVVSVRVGAVSKNTTDPNIIALSPSDMWLKFKELVQQNQIKGIDAVTLEQLVNRMVITKNGKLLIESKIDFKTRMGVINPKLAHSPDESDAMMLAMQVAVERLGLYPGLRWDKGINPSVSMFLQQKEMAYRQGNIQVNKRPNRPPLIANFSSALDS